MSISKETGRVIGIMTILVFIGLSVAWFYYNSVNKSEDPRVIQAKLLYKKFQDISETGDLEHSLQLLDSIEWIYNKYPHYKNSYELGVVHNNRSAIYLTKALHYSPDSAFRLMNIKTAGDYAQKSILVYQQWLEKYDGKTEEEIKAVLLSDFLNGLNVGESQIEKIIKKRMKETLDAQFETKRRLSVSYTNLGIVKRHQGNAEAAADLYKKALELWERNLSAKNNLNILLDQPLEKQNFIQKMFPPERKKK